LPEYLWGADVELVISKAEATGKTEAVQSPQLGKEEYFAIINSYCGTLPSVDYPDLRDETD